MRPVSHHGLDQQLGITLDRVGMVGQELRSALMADIKEKVLRQEAPAPLEIMGPTGSGRKTAAAVIHGTARRILGRRGATVTLDCGVLQDGSAEEQLRKAVERSRGGTLILDRADVLGEAHIQRTYDDVIARDADTLLVAIRRQNSASLPESEQCVSRIDLKPLHARQADLWELIDHFFKVTAADRDLGVCRGFSRQAKADIAAIVQETELASVRVLRDVVRDLLFEVASDGDLEIKVTSEQVRPYLEERFGQTPSDRETRDAALIESQFESLVNKNLLDHLAEVHGVPSDMLERQTEVLRQLIGYIHDKPRSYRNTMDRADEILRASLWLLTGATTQAEFRRFFGEERFMRPTKSVAWAFYNRVFKRDV